MMLGEDQKTAIDGSQQRHIMLFLEDTDCLQKLKKNSLDECQLFSKSFKLFDYQKQTICKTLGIYTMEIGNMRAKVSPP